MKQTPARLSTPCLGSRALAGGLGEADLRRQDALVAATRFIRDAETIAIRHPDLLITAGQIEARPGASNVIPGFVRLSVDVRVAVRVMGDFLEQLPRRHA